MSTADPKDNANPQENQLLPPAPPPKSKSMLLELFSSVITKSVEHSLGIFLSAITLTSGFSAYQANNAAGSLSTISSEVQKIEKISEKIQKDAMQIETFVGDLGALNAFNKTLEDNFSQIRLNQQQLARSLERYSGEFGQSHHALAIKDEEQKRKLFEIEHKFTNLFAEIESIDESMFIASKYAVLLESTNTQLRRELLDLNSRINESMIMLVELKPEHTGGKLVSMPQEK